VSPDHLRRVDITDQPALIEEQEQVLRQIREGGVQVINELFMATRTVTFHAADNVATEYPIQHLTHTLTRLIDAVGATQLIVADGEAYINDVRVRVGARYYDNLVHVIELLDRHKVGGIRFGYPLLEDEVRTLVVGLARPPHPDEPYEWLREFYRREGVPVQLDTPFVRADELSLAMDRVGGAYGTFAYAQGVQALKDYANAAIGAGYANPLAVHRSMQELVDFGTQHLSELTRLHLIRGAEDPYFNHAINVATLSIAVGRKLGLSRVELWELGVSALFHDVGYAGVGDNKMRAQQREELGVNHALHPILGVRVLAQEKGYARDKAHRMRVAIEHHMHHLRPGGYPPMLTERLGVFTRIVQVCDHYDAAVAPDPRDGTRGALPMQALGQVVAGAGTRFDPVVVDAFTQLMGRYPVGTVLRLNTLDVGLVISDGRSVDAYDRPVVRLVLGVMGEELNQEIDLAEVARDALYVTAVLDPEAEGLDLAELIFGDLEAIDELTSMDEESYHQLLEGKPVDESQEIVFEFDVD